MRPFSRTPVMSHVAASIRSVSSHWIARLLYGAYAAPHFGTWSSRAGVGEVEERNASQVLYCKALIHASGGGRLARDWVAGCSAALCPSETLLRIALSHHGSEQDVEQYREYLLTHRKSALESGSSGGDSDATPSSAGGAERLGNMPEVRCFVYDAMRAACFHRHHKVPEEERQRLYAVARRLELDDEITHGIWKLVEKEVAVEREKRRALDHPWSE